jgi:hypothetical protein
VTAASTQGRFVTVEIDTGAFAKFAIDVVPSMLVEVVGVPADVAESVGADIAARGLALAALDRHERRILSMPFFEETFYYDPEDAPDYLRAHVAVAVRNSALEHVHVEADLNEGGITALTTMAAGPLSHLLAGADRGLVTIPDRARLVADQWRSIRSTYPRAWASFEALATLASQGGGRAQLSLPRDLSAPEAPVAEVDAAVRDDGVVVLDAMDPRYDQQTVETLTRIVQEQQMMFTPTCLGCRAS